MLTMLALVLAMNKAEYEKIRGPAWAEYKKSQKK